MEHSSCDKEEEPTDKDTVVFNIPDVYLEESKDDNESDSDNESDDESDDESETEEDDYRARLTGRGRRVRQSIR